MLKFENEGLQILGYIKIGEKAKETSTSKNGVEFQKPVKLDHFIVTNTSKGPDGNYIQDAAVMKSLGKDPKRLSVTLLNDGIPENFRSGMVMYQGSGTCLCKSDDGIDATRRVITTVNGAKVLTNDWENTHCDGCSFQAKDSAGITKCKPFGRLTVVLKDSKILGGVYLFQTTSWNSIWNIQNQLTFFNKLSFGMLAGLPLILMVTPKSTRYTDASGQKRQTTVFQVGIFYDGQIGDFYIECAKVRKRLLSDESYVKTVHIEAKTVLSIPDTDLDYVSEYNPDLHNLDSMPILETMPKGVDPETGQIGDSYDSEDIPEIKNPKKEGNPKKTENPPKPKDQSQVDFDGGQF